MLRAPIWSTSAYSATTPTLSGSSTSVTTGSPVALRASARSRSPSSLEPLEGVGRGARLERPAAQEVGPAGPDALGRRQELLPDSTEQGPAMTATRPPPIAAPSIWTTVSVGRTSRLASLKGWRIGTMLSTHSSASSAWSRVLKRSSPIAPITVRCSPRLDVRAEPERLDASTHVLDLAVPGSRLQHDDHLAPPLRPRSPRRPPPPGSPRAPRAARPAWNPARARKTKRATGGGFRPPVAPVSFGSRYGMGPPGRR